MASVRILCWLAAAALCAQLCTAHRQLLDDPTLYDATKMSKQQVADAMAYQRLVTGYTALNSVRPLLTEVNCHYKPVYLGANSSSKAAAAYVAHLEQVVSDGNAPVPYVNATKATQFNQSWSLGVDWQGMCIEDANLTKPVCNFTFDWESRALGMRAIPPDVTFLSCGISMNNGITGDNNLALALDVAAGQMNYSAVTNSSTCFVDHDLTHALVYSAYQARSIERIDLLTTFRDASPDGPPGDYTVSYQCQYTYNTVDTNPIGNIVQIPISGQVIIPFDPIGNAAGLDPRVTSWLPNLPDGGPFGPPGDGGNLGKKL